MLIANSNKSITVFTKNGSLSFSERKFGKSFAELATRFNRDFGNNFRPKRYYPKEFAGKCEIEKTSIKVKGEARDYWVVYQYRLMNGGTLCNRITLARFQGQRGCVRAHELANKMNGDKQ